MTSDCSTVSVAVFVVVAPHWAPIFCSSQDLLVATTGTNTRNATFKIVHTALLHQ